MCQEAMFWAWRRVMRRPRWPVGIHIWWGYRGEFLGDLLSGRPPLETPSRSNREYPECPERRCTFRHFAATAVCLNFGNLATQVQNTAPPERFRVRSCVAKFIMADYA